MFHNRIAALVFTLGACALTACDKKSTTEANLTQETPVVLNHGPNLEAQRLARMKNTRRVCDGKTIEAVDTPTGPVTKRTMLQSGNRFKLIQDSDGWMSVQGEGTGTTYWIEKNESLGEKVCFPSRMKVQTKTSLWHSPSFGDSTQKVRELPKGSVLEVQIKSEDSKWWKVSVEGNTGWVFFKYIDFVDDDFEVKIASALTRNERAFLWVIASAEMGAAYRERYDTLFGFQPIPNYSNGKGGCNYQDHPRIFVRSGGYVSSAAGRWQIMDYTWDTWAPRLGLKDFCDDSQDKVALALIRDAGVNPSSSKNYSAFLNDMRRLAPVWCSLPGERRGQCAGQPQKSFGQAWAFYQEGLNRFK